MKRFGFVLTLLISSFTNSLMAQDQNEGFLKEKVDFYEHRAQKDALYEQSMVMNNREDEVDFWKDQKRYEKDLKQTDGAAYRTYMKGKKEAYLEYTAQCGTHCERSDYYVQQIAGYLSYPEFDYPHTDSGLGAEAKIGESNIKVEIFQ